MQKFIDKVWFTYKARIRTAERLQGNDTHSQNLLVWYALIATALSIIAIRYPHILGPDTDITTAIMSVALLIISLLVTNNDFRGRALQMRKNYLGLQRLYNSLMAEPGLSVPNDSMISDYATLLDETENHLAIDDKYWRVRFDQNTSRPVTGREKCDVYVYIIVRIGILTFLYTIPLAAVLLLLLQNK